MPTSRRQLARDRKERFHRWVGKLRDYERKRNLRETPEPSGKERRKPAKLPRFVVQEHHASRLHWDFRLERDGVLVSWAVPKGVPPDPKRNHLAVHVEDHPIGYIDFAGSIPKGQYGGGEVTIWDRGTYETHKWELEPGRRGEVMVTLHGERTEGRYVLFQTGGQNWMIHRMDPPQDAEREPMPERLTPMMARLAGELPSNDDAYGYEFKWDGIRAVAYVRGGRLQLMTRNLEDVTARYPELRPLGDRLGSTEAVLDGEIVALGPHGIPSFEQLQQRMGLNAETDIKRRAKEVPVVYMLFDLIYLNGRMVTQLPYSERRKLLQGLKLKAEHWDTPAHQKGDGQAMLDGSARSGLEGIMAKRLDSKYELGKRTSAWLKVKNHLRQELVIGGWLEGQGRRRDLGALLVGHHEGKDFVYAGKVGTGFDDRTLDQLVDLLGSIAVEASPFTAGPKPPRASHFVEPKLVAEFQFAEWTRGGQLRAPVFKGLRNDKEAREVTRERPVDA